VGVRLLGVAVELGDQPTDLVALEQGLAFGPLDALAVADLIQPRKMSSNVITEAPSQVIDPHFFSQAVRGIVGKAVCGIVLVDQRRQADGLVVLITNSLPLGILLTAWQATPCARGGGVMHPYQHQIACAVLNQHAYCRGIALTLDQIALPTTARQRLFDLWRANMNADKVRDLTTAIYPTRAMRASSQLWQQSQPQRLFLQSLCKAICDIIPVDQRCQTVSISPRLG